MNYFTVRQTLSQVFFIPAAPELYSSRENPWERGWFVPLALAMKFQAITTGMLSLSLL